MKSPLLAKLLAGWAATAIAAQQDSHQQDPEDIIPTNSGDCNALCNITPTCQSTLFDTVSRQCYSFDCVVGDQQIPYQFIGYRKPGSSDLCPAENEIPAPGAPPSSAVLAPPLPASSSEPAPTTPCCESDAGKPETEVGTGRKPSEGTPTPETSGTRTTASPTAGAGDNSGDAGGGGGSSGQGDASGRGASDASGTVVPGAPNANGANALTQRWTVSAGLLLGVLMAVPCLE